MPAVSAAQLRDTVRVLHRRAWHISPAIALALPPALMRNIHRCSIDDARSELGLCAELARELFGRARDSASAAPAAARSRSRAAAHLTPAMAGHILGAGLARAPAEVAEGKLRRLGVETNRVRGEWTGVSFARFARLARLACVALDTGDDHAPNLVPSLGGTLLARFACEVAGSKGELLDFLLAVDEHVPVIADEWTDLRRPASDLRAAWASSAISAEEFAEAPKLQAAARRLLPSRCSRHKGGESRHVDGGDVEVVAASLALAHAFKPAVRMAYHAFDGGPPRLDCVEVAVRELIELFIYDPTARALDAALLPPTATRALFEFYSGNSGSSGHSGVRGGKGGGGDDASSRWFALCQGLDGCAYLSASPRGTKYELAPNLANVAKVRQHNNEDNSSDCSSVVLAASQAAGALLGAGDDSATWTAVTQLVVWAAESGGGGSSGGGLASLRVSERVVSHREQLSDVTRTREVVTLSCAAGELEITLQEHPPICTATHRSLSPWARHDDCLRRVRRDHLDAWAEGGAVAPAVAALWPALLGDGMLMALPDRPTTLQAESALLSSRWAHDDAELWSPVENATDADRTDSTLAAEARRAADARAIAAVRAAAAADSNAAPLLRWVLGGIRPEIGPIEPLAAALASAPPAALDDPAIGELLGEFGELCSAMVRYAHAEADGVGVLTRVQRLREACRSLSALDTWRLVRFALLTRGE